MHAQSARRFCLQLIPDGTHCKGALCLTMSSFDGLSDAEFAGMMPGLLAMFSMQGLLVLLWGILLLPIGFGVQAVALLTSRTVPRWQALLFLLGVLLIAAPDGVELVNLAASILLSIAFIPYGIRLIRLRGQQAEIGRNDDQAPVAIHNSSYQ
jgi:hypothetical protein